MPRSWCRWPTTPGKKFPSQEFPDTSFAGRVGDQHVCEHLLPGSPAPSHLPITQLQSFSAPSSDCRPTGTLSLKSRSCFLASNRLNVVFKKLRSLQSSMTLAWSAEWPQSDQPWMLASTGFTFSMWKFFLCWLGLITESDIKPSDFIVEHRLEGHEKVPVQIKLGQDMVNRSTLTPR